MQSMARTLLGLVGISNMAAAATEIQIDSGVWLKLLLGLVGFTATVTCLFYGQVLAHFRDHYKRDERIIEINTKYTDKAMKNQKAICKLSFETSQNAKTQMGLKIEEE